MSTKMTTYQAALKSLDFKVVLFFGEKRLTSTLVTPGSIGASSR